MKKIFNFFCFLIAIFMMISTMFSTAFAIEETTIDNIAEIPVCGDDCAKHEHEEEGGGRGPFCGNGHNWGSEYPDGGHTNDYYCWIYYIKQDCKNLLCWETRIVRTVTDPHTWVPKVGGGYTCKTCSYPYPW